MRHNLHHGFVLRVERNSAGMRIPFDKMYFFKKEDEILFPRVFKDAMVFPVNTQLAKQIDETVRQSKELPLRAFPHARSQEQKLLETATQDHPFGKIVSKRKEYLALVPVLFTRYGSKLLKESKRRKGRRKHSVFPAYLIARPNREATIDMLRRALSVRAYFILGGRVVKPICLMCPRHQYWLQGACHIGEDNCYTHLAQAKRSDLVLGVERYEQYAKMIDEPEMKGIENDVFSGNKD